MDILDNLKKINEKIDNVFMFFISFFVWTSALLFFSYFTILNYQDLSNIFIYYFLLKLAKISFLTLFVYSIYFIGYYQTAYFKELNIIQQKKDDVENYMNKIFDLFLLNDKNLLEKMRVGGYCKKEFVDADKLRKEINKDISLCKSILLK